VEQFGAEQQCQGFHLFGSHAGHPELNLQSLDYPQLSLAAKLQCVRATLFTKTYYLHTEIFAFLKPLVRTTNCRY